MEKRKRNKPRSCVEYQILSDCGIKAGFFYGRHSCKQIQWTPVIKTYKSTTNSLASNFKAYEACDDCDDCDDCGDCNDCDDCDDC